MIRPTYSVNSASSTSSTDSASSTLAGRWAPSPAANGQSFSSPANSRFSTIGPCTQNYLQMRAQCACIDWHMFGVKRSSCVISCAMGEGIERGKGRWLQWDWHGDWGCRSKLMQGMCSACRKSPLKGTANLDCSNGQLLALTHGAYLTTKLAKDLEIRHVLRCPLMLVQCKPALHDLVHSW